MTMNLGKETRFSGYGGDSVLFMALRSNPLEFVRLSVYAVCAANLIERGSLCDLRPTFYETSLKMFTKKSFRQKII